MEFDEEYVFKCESCDAHFEECMSITEERVALNHEKRISADGAVVLSSYDYLQCPECGSDDVHKISKKYINNRND